MRLTEPRGHMTSKWRHTDNQRVLDVNRCRTDVDTSSVFRIDVKTTSFRRHVPAGRSKSNRWYLWVFYPWAGYNMHYPAGTWRWNDVITSSQRIESVWRHIDVVCLLGNAQLHIYLKPCKTYALPSLHSSPKTSLCPPLTHTLKTDP